MYLVVWNRSAIFKKSKINQGVKPDYRDRVSNWSKLANIVNFYRKPWDTLQNVFSWKVTLIYVDVWNRSDIFRKYKISQGVKPDYYDRVSNSSKFADIVNFYRKLWNILENVYGWKVSLMYLDVWNKSEVFRKSKVSQGVKPDYYDWVSNSSKFLDIVNFYRKLSDILQNVFAWKVTIMYVHE